MKYLMKNALSLLVVIFLCSSCTKEEESINTIELPIPSSFVLTFAEVIGDVYKIGAGGNIQSVALEEYQDNVGGFQGYLFEDLMDSLKNTWYPAGNIFIQSESLLDVNDIYISTPTPFDLTGVNYTLENNTIKVSQEFFGDLFLLDIDIESESLIRIDYTAYQYSKKADFITRSPVSVYQFNQDKPLLGIADALQEEYELSIDDYVMVIKAAYYLEKE